MEYLQAGQHRMQQHMPGLPCTHWGQECPCMQQQMGMACIKITSMAPPQDGRFCYLSKTTTFQPSLQQQIIMSLLMT